MHFNDETTYLKDALVCKEQIICQLKEKLYTYNDDLEKKKDMKKQLCNLEQWLEEIKHKSVKNDNDILKDLDVQIEKLNEIEAYECSLRNTNNSLLDAKDGICQRLNETQKKEQMLLMEVEELKMCTDRIQNDICNVQAEADKNGHLVQSWSKTLRCREEERDRVRSELDEQKVACGRLNDACAQLTVDVECKTKDIAAAKSRLTLTVQRLDHAAETLVSESNIKRQQLHVLETECQEAGRAADDEAARTQNLQASAAELRDARERDNRLVSCRIRELREENRAMAEGLCCVKNRAREQCDENACVASEIVSLSKQVASNECLIEKMKRSAEVYEQQKNGADDQLGKDAKSLQCDILAVEGKIADADREIRALQEKSKRPAPAPGPCASRCPNDNPDKKMSEKLKEAANFVGDLKRQTHCTEDKPEQSCKLA